LSLPLASIEDLLRSVAAARAPEREIAEEDRPTKPPSSPVKSSTAAELLSTSSRHRFSTLSPSLDRLIAQFTPSLAYNTHNGVEDPQRLWQETKNGAIVPGMSVEISGPPGAGKTVISIALAINARMSAEGDDNPEVLIIGELDVMRQRF
jgi:RAD51-like protein 2